MIKLYPVSVKRTFKINSQTEICLCCVPFQREMLKGFSGDKTQLGSAEKFLLALVSIPGYGYFVLYFKFLLSF